MNIIILFQNFVFILFFLLNII